ncbi:MAG TPA: DUF222 domain-containing protein [Kofleriaceae bacterium]
MNELEQLGERIAEQAAHLDAAMHRFLTDLREFDQRGGWHEQGARTCAHWLAWRVGWDLVTSRERVRVAGKLAEFPTIDDALRRGEMSYSKVRAMLRVATPANEVLLLDHARLMTASQLETLCRKYAIVQRQGQDPHPVGDEQRRYVRRRDTEDGMVKIEAVLHPEEAELVWTMLNHAATQLAREPDPSACADSAESWGAVHVSGAVEASPATVAVTSLLSDAAVCQLDDSAESRQQTSAPAPTATAARGSVRDLDTCPIGDSEESHQQPAAPNTTATASPISARSFAACPVDDSAESLLHASLSDATAPGSHVAPAAPGDFNTYSTNDSAESLPHASVPDATASGSSITPAAPSDFATCPANDPAESLPHASASDTTAPAAPEQFVAPEHFAGCPSDDSAESWEQTSPPALTANASLGRVVPCPIGDSAESPSPEIPSRSLLDRLLDEADALRIAEAAAHGEPEASSSTAEASPSDLIAARTPGRLQQRADAARCAFNRADALLAVAQRYLRGDRPNRSPIEIVLTIPRSSLHAGAADPLEAGEMGESFVSSEAARRLSCDAGVVEVVEDERGMPLSVGRKRRTIAGALKRALRKRDTTCSYPGCMNRMFLEGHHIQHWADGGETSLRNSALLCSAHHHYVHEYGYAIELGPDQRPQFRDPHGRLVAEVPERPVIADLGWPRIRAENAPLSVTADTIACG